jgi:hypothetical protein
MGIDETRAIGLATDFANANGFRVVPSFDGVEWVEDAIPVKYSNAARIDAELAVAEGVAGGWWVTFEKLLHPEVLSESPGAICVLVIGESAQCRFYPLL